MKLYNQDIKFMDFECYDKNLSDLESDFKKNKICERFGTVCGRYCFNYKIGSPTYLGL